MDPAAVFASLAALGGTPPHTVVIGCEVADIDERMGLSPAVAATVIDAATAIEEIVGRLLDDAKVG
jgi:hydrogenase maturation protease